MVPSRTKQLSLRVECNETVFVGTGTRVQCFIAVYWAPIDSSICTSCTDRLFFLRYLFIVRLNGIKNSVQDSVS